MFKSVRKGASWNETWEKNFTLWRPWKRNTWLLGRPVCVSVFVWVNVDCQKSVPWFASTLASWALPELVTSEPITKLLHGPSVKALLFAAFHFGNYANHYVFDKATYHDWLASWSVNYSSGTVQMDTLSPSPQPLHKGKSLWLDPGFWKKKKFIRRIYIQTISVGNFGLKDIGTWHQKAIWQKFISNHRSKNKNVDTVLSKTLAQWRRQPRRNDSAAMTTTRPIILSWSSFRWTGV